MPEKLKIIINPNPILRKKSAEISPKRINSQETADFCFDMGKLMLEYDGIGLAAPQVGKNMRIIAINANEIMKRANFPKIDTARGLIYIINPKIIKKSWAGEWGEEGCLSFPNIFGQVRRYKKITCQYFNLSGKKVKLNADGLLARVIQHEIDHLDGILFIDKAEDIKKI